MIIERRKHKRYLVKGTVELAGPIGKFPGEVVSVGGGGILAFSDMVVPLGTEVAFRYGVEGYPSEIEGKGRIVRTETGIVAISYIEEPEGIHELLTWLEMAFVFAAF